MPLVHLQEILLHSNVIEYYFVSENKSISGNISCFAPTSLRVRIDQLKHLNGLINMLSLSTDCICWSAEVQCKFPTYVPANKGIDIPDFCCHSGHVDSTCTYDPKRHCSRYLSFHAYWMGNAAGK